jgi:hypothetical protein
MAGKRRIGSRKLKVGASGNALSVAANRGFPIMGFDGFSHKGIFFNQFFKSTQRSGPQIFVGLKSGNQWVVRRTRPS